MRIVKITHTHQFAQIANSTLRDWRLSLKARGLMGVIISLPEDWEITIEWLASQGEKDGRDSVRAGMAELEQYCYARYVKHRGEGGKLAGGHWEVREDTSLPWPSPTTDFPKSVKPKSEEPKPAEPKPENPTLQRQDYKDSLLQPLNAPEIVRDKARGTVEALKAFAKEIGATENDGEVLFLRWEGTGWKNGGTAIKCWRSVMRSHFKSGYLPSQRNNEKSHASNGNRRFPQAPGSRNAGTVNDADDYAAQTKGA